MGIYMKYLLCVCVCGVCVCVCVYNMINIQAGDARLLMLYRTLLGVCWAYADVC